MLTQAWPFMAATMMFFLHMCLPVESVAEADRILRLPGQPRVSFRQFSGYITVDDKQDRALFYYFVEAKTNPASKPLVLWLTGGPGCSSVGAGAFCEHGPFKPAGDILVKHDYSWNKAANMLYLESPAGVGFSYSANKSFYSSVNDAITARDSLVFLEHWFSQFPEYKNREFFITGESYGGHYVPQLAELIIRSKAPFNLKGIAIGNPLLEFNTDLNSRAEYLWSHGLISDATYELCNSVCNFSQITIQQQAGGALSPPCSRVWTEASREISTFVNTHDVILDVCLSSNDSQSQLLHPLGDATKIDVCVIDETISYLNRKDVQKAFHARLVGVEQWTMCSKVQRYEVQSLEIPTIGLLGSLVKSGIRVLVYSGDQDSLIPLTGTRKLVNGLAKELGLDTSVPYRAWFEGRQVAGWTQVYGDILTFATVRGGAHEAPFSQPERSLALFYAFLAAKPLPVAVPSTTTKPIH
ncbi:serine carboxypeptidase-like 45 isoform X2 [Diospyros lotus]|uniref:serine carboxypeptidase-like 45 isoform X2 n=1 Tax=Diospyros lotus TaxID=55363 RepID=UPI002259AE2C|nr:serine carboxypeptidase-like 45 isoform X2 [Diospyros lotus]